MGVVPFVLKSSDGVKYNVMPEEERNEHKDFQDNNPLVIRQMDVESLKNSSCNISYDLHVGDEYALQTKRKTKKYLKDEDSIVIKPRGAVIIYTMEQVVFPERFFGLILPKATLLQYGISNTCSKVDPGYSGRLLVTLFNLGNSKIKLKKGDAICCLALYDVDESYPLIAYSKKEKLLSDTKNTFEKKQGLLGRLGLWINQNATLCIVIAAILTLIATIIGIYL